MVSENKSDIASQRKFVDPDFAITNADSIKPWVDKLLEKNISSEAEILKWLEDYSELEAIIGEDMNIRYVDMTCDTKDEKKKEAYLKFVREIQPKITEWGNALDRKYYDSPFRKNLDDKEYGRLDRMLSSAIELYTEKNIPLSVKLAEMSQQYQSITGGWSVEFDGKKQTMPQMSKYLFKTDRSLREGAWRAMADRRLKDSETLENLFDKMTAARHEFALNLGLKDYREYSFKNKLRDYTPEECLEFHESIEKACVPLVRKIAARRKKQMRVDSLRPWDMSVDPLGRPPLEPFSSVDKLQDGVEEIFNKIDSRLGEWFSAIRVNMD
ncbi:MAG: M3 family metallopeptidase, partial [Nitrospinota bacterium]